MKLERIYWLEKRASSSALAFLKIVKTPPLSQPPPLNKTSKIGELVVFRAINFQRENIEHLEARPSLLIEKPVKTPHFSPAKPQKKA